MNRTALKQISLWLRLATDKSILQPAPVIAIVALTTFIHVMTSVDLGFVRIETRIPIAALSVLPLFGLIYLAQVIVTRVPTLQIPILLTAYSLGGLIRGEILQAALIRFNVLTSSSVSFRVVSGIIVVGISALVIGFVWTTVVNARLRLEQLGNQTRALTDALSQIRLATTAKQINFTLSFANQIKEQLSRISNSSNETDQQELDSLIKDVIKPLSKDYAQNVSRYQVAQVTSKVTLRDVWFSIDPIKHLPAPAFAALMVSLAGSSSFIAIFGLRNAIELTVSVSLVLVSCMFIGFGLAKQRLPNLKPPIRDIVITLGFLVISIPPALITIWALADTPNPTAYVLPGLIMLPVFGWLTMTGNAAWQRLKDLTVQLESVQRKLKWSIARLNLLSWYYQGVASRLLHGPIQNSVQVAAIRLGNIHNLDERQSLFNEVLTRIETAVKGVLNQTSMGDYELAALSEVIATWQGVANIELLITAECQRALIADPPCASITVDLVQEYCSNSIRHGGSRQLEISLDLAEDTLAISILKDVRTINQISTKSGLGSEFISSVTIETEYFSQDHREQLRVLVPISVNI